MQRQRLRAARLSRVKHFLSPKSLLLLNLFPRSLPSALFKKMASETRTSATLTSTESGGQPVLNGTNGADQPAENGIPPATVPPGPIDHADADGIITSLLDNASQAQAVESINELTRDTIDSLGPRGSVRQAFDRDKIKGNLDIRVKQSVMHATFTHFRIQELEDQLQQLRADVYKLPSNFKAQKVKKDDLPRYKHTLKRSTPAEFRITLRSFDVPPRSARCWNCW